MAGMQTGTVTRENSFIVGCFNEAETLSNSRSICFSAVTAVRCDTV